MGFFDARCMVTGVSLKGSRAALVLLQQTEAAYHPIALAMTGQYDRLGSIDGIDEDENTTIVLGYFQAQLGTSTFVVQEDYLRGCKCFPIETTEHLLRGFERNMNDGEGAAVLNGQSIVFALIAATVWNAIARADTKPAKDGRAAFGERFRTAPVASQIYAERLGDVSAQLNELATVSRFLTARTIPWIPATDVGQHFSDDMRQFLAEARTAFHDSPVTLNALERYENEVSDLLED